MSGRLSRLRAQAAGHTPFHLDTGEGIISVPPPDENRLHLLLTLPPGCGHHVELTALCGPRAAVELIDAAGGDDKAVLELIVDDIQTHFAVHDAPRLGSLLDRYGAEIHADLRERGVDVLDLWRGHITVDEVYNLVDHLPRTSWFVDAVAHDDERAAAQPDRGHRRATPPRLTEFSPEAELLAAIVDRLGDVVGAVVASTGNKPTQPRPWPRPITADDRIRAERRRAGAEDLLDQILGRKRPT